MSSATSLDSLVNVGISTLTHHILDLVDPLPLDVAGTGQHRLEGPEGEVIVTLLAELLFTETEKWNNLEGKLFGCSEAL